MKRNWLPRSFENLTFYCRVMLIFCRFWDDEKRINPCISDFHRPISLSERTWRSQFHFRSHPSCYCYSFIFLPLSLQSIHIEAQNSIFLLPNYDFKTIFLLQFVYIPISLTFITNPWIKSFNSFTMLSYLIFLFLLQNKTRFISENLSSMILYIITLFSC